MKSKSFLCQLISFRVNIFVDIQNLYIFLRQHFVDAKKLYSIFLLQYFVDTKNLYNIFTHQHFR